MRLFAGIKPTEEATEHLVRALRPYRGDLRWVDPDNWHITLAFYGEQPEGITDAIIDHLTTAAQLHEEFQVSIRGAGSFNKRNLWMGVGGDTKQLKSLMAQCLIDPEERLRQRAHVTVARPARRERIGGWDPVIPDLVRALSIYEGPTWNVSELELMSSHLGKGRSGGPLYETIATVSLPAAIA